MFESGALAKHVDASRVIPLIVDKELKPAMLTGPLAQLQAREGNKDGIRRVVRDINSCSKRTHRLPDDRVDRCFDSSWKNLKSQLDKLPDPEGETPELDQGEVLSQILSLLKSGFKDSAIVRDMESKTESFRRELAKQGAQRSQVRFQINLRNIADPDAHGLLQEAWDRKVPGFDPRGLVDAIRINDVTYKLYGNGRILEK